MNKEAMKDQIKAAKLEKADADTVAACLGLPNEVSIALQQYPNKKWKQTVPTDPAIYRLFEIVGVYGETIKGLIHKAFADGIMSAVDFNTILAREENDKGDHVQLILNGKYLRYSSW